MTLTARITSTPEQPLSYNPNVAETFSWVPIDGAGRPLFAKATYNVNNPNQSGFVVTTDTATVSGNFSSLKMVTNTVFTGIVAENSSFSTIGSITFPANFVLEGPIRSYKLASGTVVAYKI